MSPKFPFQKPIIFFDGVCSLCNAVVDLLIRLDRKQIFLFAPLQGTTAQELLPPRNDGTRKGPQEGSVVYLDKSGSRDQSDAAIAICRRLGGWWSLLGVLRVVPRSMRNRVYRFIARNRYRWFGKKATCRIPTPAERARFLP